MQFTPESAQLSNEITPPWTYRVALGGLGVLFVGGSIMFGLALLVQASTYEFISELATEFGMVLAVLALIISVSFWLLTLVSLTMWLRGLWRWQRWALVVLYPVFVLQVLATGQLVIRYWDWVSAVTIASAILTLGLILVVVLHVLRQRDGLYGSWRRLRFQIPLFLWLLPSFLIVVANLLFLDQWAVRDADLQLDPVSVVAQDENVYFALPIEVNLTPAEYGELETAMERAIESDVRTLPDAEQSAWIATTAPYREQFANAMARPVYQCPRNVNDFSLTAELCPLNDYRQLATLMRIHSEYAIANGEYDQAAAYIGDVVRFADHIQSDPHARYIDHLVARAMYGIAAEALETLLLASENGRSLSPEIRAGLLFEVTEHRPQPSRLAGASVTEYQGMKQAIMANGSAALEDLGSVPSSYVWHPNRTVNGFAALARLQRDHYLAPCGDDTYGVQLNERVESAMQQSLSVTLVQPNSVGSILQRVVIASLNTSKQNSCELAARYHQFSEQIERQ